LFGPFRLLRYDLAYHPRFARTLHKRHRKTLAAFAGRGKFQKAVIIVSVALPGLDMIESKIRCLH